jgi:hypothetical protein
MNSFQFPVARKSDLVIQELQEELLVFDLKTNKAHCLNETASAVWKLCDGRNTVDDIARTFKMRTGADVPENLIWLAIDQLNDKNLLENKLEAKFAGQNRREVLKKIGLAGVIALPIVASITAPTAALAVACSGVVSDCTGCDDGTPCDVNGDGTIGTCQVQVCNEPSPVSGRSRGSRGF